MIFPIIGILKFIAKFYIFSYSLFLSMLKPGQVNPLIQVKWVTFLWVMWVTGSNHKKLDNLVYIFKHVNCGYEIQNVYWSPLDCHSSDHNSVLLAFWKNSYLLVIVCWGEKCEWWSSVGAVWVVNDREIFGITCCYYASLVWFILLIG